MRTVFGKPLDALTVEDVEAFLAEATEEGLTWEAKGNKQPHPNSVRKAVAGFANAVGGHLLIGAERVGSGNGWHLPGVEFRVDEPGTWISSLVTSGMSPAPSFEPKVFERPEGRRAVVIEVEPVPLPPCITSDGVLYQRVSGQTLPVTDQRVLGELLRRGEAARTSAESVARRAAERVLSEPGRLGPVESLLSVSMCPAFTPDHKAAIVFSREFARRLHDVVFQYLYVDPGVRYSPAMRMQQDAIRMWSGGQESSSCWTAAVYWDGCVAAVFSTLARELYIEDVIARVKQAWTTLPAVAGGLESHGPAHLVVRINQNHGMVSRTLSDPVELRRWTEVREPYDEEWALLERELERTFGRSAWEPSG